MKYVSYTVKGNKSLGVLINNNIIDVFLVSNEKIPNNMLEFLKNFEVNHTWVKNNIDEKTDYQYSLDEVIVNPPISNPTSFRDAYAFRQHVEAGRKSRGLEMIPEYDEFPVFYFSNHNSMFGPGVVHFQSMHLDKLDFELEIGILIGKRGKNIKSKDAHEYIAGLMIMNDWSARAIQFKEMKLNLGPAKGKDFATSIGPYLLTIDDIMDFYVEKKNGFTFNLEMKAYVNDVLVSSDNMKNMTWSFSEIIERASYGATLFPGDLIGSGTCATGCFLELNQTNKTNVWLKDKDKVKLSIERLGVLENQIQLID